MFSSLSGQLLPIDYYNQYNQIIYNQIIHTCGAAFKTDFWTKMFLNLIISSVDGAPVFIISRFCSNFANPTLECEIHRQTGKKH